ncbi:DUF2163 domain-containing protein [Aliiruegeria sabulilitoris]|uniref:DUF2163 domain-containing protein n=1 Tax=Aliiruegeria sabulilitoris TaxID=1510458 RepID=UPI000836E38B|nr:DUF2163 domain-containing protein [Aliiruegeria sabulilitoris]NDR56059.1 DUF2163 domain-containing protein [Pseudoruegeria sp. M32A2M]
MAVASGQSQALYAHLAEGVTTSCRCWKVVRKDGWSRGFTDHDNDLTFNGTVFRASSGFTASALEVTTGLSVNNTEAVGALSDAGISELDIEAGRFDGAAVTLWLVNWEATDQRAVSFRGTIGEISRNDGSFTAELRGLTEQLNQPMGRVFQGACSAKLGDSKCRFDTTGDGFVAEFTLMEVEDARVFRVPDGGLFENGWFERGLLTVLDGEGGELKGWVKNDIVANGERELTLWQGLRCTIQPGDRVQLIAGCDKSASSCANKFGNFRNFRGCPHIPGEDWLTSYPRSGDDYDGGSINAPIVS